MKAGVGKFLRGSPPVERVVKANTGRTEGARDEAIQVAAMALRYVLDIDATAPQDSLASPPGFWLAGSGQDNRMSAGA